MAAFSRGSVTSATSALKLLTIAVLICSEETVLATDDEWDEYLLCRQCGHEVTKATDLKRVASAQALRQRNDTILGMPEILIQLFENPAGRAFEVITTKKADVTKFDQVYPGDTWFPGFSWRIAVCPKCGQHLGWSYEPHNHEHGKKDTEETFLGLILDHLIHQDYADSLLVIPKMYRS
ncbi:uncharacterized protein [Ptychodera flava]|uniref:uncharacterized protein n=1 Tax=Ptychodera flava TaxID=63121 RepID=UPI00396A96D7